MSFASMGHPFVFRKTGKRMVKLIIRGYFKHAGDCDLSKSVKIGQQRDERKRKAFFQTDFGSKDKKIFFKYKIHISHLKIRFL